VTAIVQSEWVRGVSRPIDELTVGVGSKSARAHRRSISFDGTIKHRLS
jgi:hypothetical protein